MGKIISLFLCAIFCLFFSTFGFGETITLKSGQKVEGKIIEQTDKYVKLEFEGIELIFYNDEISAIDQTPSGEADTASSQMESLYKAYTSYLKTAVPAPTSKESIQKPLVVEPEKIQPETVVLVEQKAKEIPVTSDKVSRALLYEKKIKASLNRSSTDKTLPK